ncbi:MAG: MlaD family protein [Candidatus Margulisiibacteriota bacterium]|jgi:phospholipid/cholesterol/gamma-HCH transport system substrate-binding protein
MQHLEPKTTVKIGVFVFICLVAIGFLLLWKSNLFLKASGYKLIGQFNNISGLIPGSEVRYRGYRIGRVLNIEPGPKNIKAYFWIDRSIEIPIASKIKVAFDGLIGEKYLLIIPNPNSSIMIKPGGTLIGFSGPGLSDFIEVGTQNLEETKVILASLRKIFTNQQVLDSIKNSILALNNITSGIETLVSELDDISKQIEIKKTINDFQSIIKSLKFATDTIIIEGKFPQNLNETLANINQISKDIKVITNTLSNKEASEKITKTLNNIEEISEDLKNILSDPQLKSSLTNTIQESEKVIKKSSSIVNAISSIKVNYDVGAAYNGVSKKLNYKGDVSFTLNDKFLLLGLNDKLDTTNILNLQLGKFWNPNLASRIGFFYSYPGISLDYLLSNSFVLGAEAYNLNKVFLDLYLKYHILKEIDLMAGTHNELTTGKYDLSLGISLHSNN